MNQHPKYIQRLLFLSFGHGLNDFSAGYMLGSLLYFEADNNTVVAGFLLYNLFAFGGQYFVAKLLSRFQDLKKLLTLSIGVNILAVLFFRMEPLSMLTMAGIASAIYHVAGATACLDKNRATPIGIFAAPGILGLLLGGYLAYLRMDIYLSLFLVYILFGWVVQLLSIPQQYKGEEKNEVKQDHGIDQHDILMILLLAIISLRSAVWNIVQIIHDQDYYWLVAIACSAFAGKLLGGWISDKIGWRVYSFISLTAAMPLVSFFKEEILLFCIGIGLLQSSIPASTALTIRAFQQDTGRGVALSFGTSVIAGLALTFIIQFYATGIVVFYFMLLLFLLSILLLWWRVKHPPFSFSQPVKSKGSIEN